ncbi:MAG: ABC transporter substrate-binding protein [Thermodesulfobacteriota bacterium]
MDSRQMIYVVMAGIFIVSSSWMEASAEGISPPESLNISINMAVEFMDHAAVAFIARDQDWFTAAGLNIKTFESFESGMALAAALARDDVQVAYLCLVPAINACVNAGVSMKIVAGTHQYGYGLAVDRRRIKTVKDMEKSGVRIGCVQEGGAVDVLMRKIIDIHRLDPDRVLKNVKRMPPAKQLLAIKTGQLDAVMLPEQWLTMAESSGYEVLVTAQDVWPQMQGSVLAVKDELIRDHPETVKILFDLLARGNTLIRNEPGQAAEIVARQMRLSKDGMSQDEKIIGSDQTAVSPEILERSMKRMEFTADISPEEVQNTIDYMARLGYLKKKVPAEDILDLRFIQHEHTP